MKTVVALLVFTLAGIAGLSCAQGPCPREDPTLYRACVAARLEAARAAVIVAREASAVAAEIRDDWREDDDEPESTPGDDE